MKKKTITIIVLVSLAVFIVFGVASCLMSSLYIKENGGFKFDYNFDTAEANESAEVSLAGVDTIEINAIAADIVFSESDDMLSSNLYILGYRQSPQVTLSSYVDGTTAHIEVVYPETSLRILRTRLTVGLPADFAGEVIVKTVSGDVKGNLDNRLSAFSMSTTSGDMSLSLTGIEDFAFKSVSGDLTLSADISDSVSAVSASGEVSIDGVAEDDADVSVKTISGDVHLTYSAACPTTVNTTSGDIRIDLPKDAPIQLDFSSTAGDYFGHISTSPDGAPFLISSISGDLSFE